MPCLSYKNDLLAHMEVYVLNTAYRFKLRELQLAYLLVWYCGQCASGNLAENFPGNALGEFVMKANASPLRSSGSGLVFCIYGSKRQDLTLVAPDPGGSS